MNNFREKYDRFNYDDWKQRVVTRARSTSHVFRDLRRPNLDTYYEYLHAPSKLIEKARVRLSKSDSNLVREAREALHRRPAPICLHDDEEDIPIRPQRHKCSAASHHNLQYYRNYRNRVFLGESSANPSPLASPHQGFGYGFDHWYSNNNMSTTAEENAKVERRKNKSNEPRPSSSGFQSFLKLFKKPDRRHAVSSEGIHTSVASSNHEAAARSGSSSSTSSSPTLELEESDAEETRSSSSSSEDSLFSIATNGFSFIPVDIYQPDEETLTALEISNGPLTDSYRQRLRQRERVREADKSNDLTLRKKYKLFSTETLRGPEKKPKLASEAPTLPSPNLPSGSKTDELSHRKSRRAVSDSSKDRRAGAYVHVKGKRKAPQPPSPNTSTNDNTPRSTLGRKKRPAPPPPIPRVEEATSTTSLLDDKDIRALIEGRAFQPIELPVPSMMTVKSEPSTSTSPAKKLTELQKQQLLEKVVGAQEEPKPSTSRQQEDLPSFLAGDVLTLDKGVFKFCKQPETPRLPVDPEERPLTPVSPLSPRPWFKRQTTTERSVNPFKKDFFLKTVDRRHKKKPEDDLPEVGFCRNSLLEHSEKLNLLPTMRLRAEKSPEQSEKRRSGIGIPNISELDREAAEIVRTNHAAEHLMKRQQMLSKMNSMEEEPEPPRSARDLISRFEATSSSTTFQAKVSSPKASKKLLNTRVELANTVFKSWVCPYCTLENPSWKIVCLACEKLKPCDSVRRKFGGRERSQEAQPPDEWEAKREKVLKYFQPNGLAKSASEASVSSVVAMNGRRGSESPKVPGSPALQLRRIAMENAAEKSKEKKDHSFSLEIFRAFRKQEASPPERDRSASREPRPEPSLRPSTSQESPDRAVVQQNRQPSEEPPSKLTNGFRPLSPTPMSPRSSALLNIFEPIDVPESPNESPPKEIVAEPLNIFEPMDEPCYQKPPNANGFLDAMEPPRSEPYSRMSTESLDRVGGHVEIKYKDTVFARKEVMITPQNPEEEEKLKQKKEKLSNKEELEKEKERLREMIKAMNAKALAEKYPTIEKKDEAKLVSPVMEAKITLEPLGPPVVTMEAAGPSSQKEEPKLGAIKKLFRKDSPKREESSEAAPETKEEKPKKVSSSVQTPGVLKKTDTEEASASLYENIQPAPNKKEDDTAEKAKYRRQFKSSKGLDSFKASLKFSPASMSSTNTLAVNKLLRSLENAIADGEFDQAATLAMELAKMKVALSVMRQKDRPMSGNWENVVLTVHIEDKEKSLGPTSVTVSPLWTIQQLKQKFLKDFGYPVANQSWIFGDTMMVENNLTLLDYKIMGPNDVYLYLADPELAKAELMAPLAEVAELDEISLSLTKTMEFERELEKFEEEVAKSPPRFPKFQGLSKNTKEEVNSPKIQVKAVEPPKAKEEPPRKNGLHLPAAKEASKDYENAVFRRSSAFTSADTNILNVSDPEEEPIRLPTPALDPKNFSDLKKNPQSSNLKENPQGHDLKKSPPQENPQAPGPKKEPDAPEPPQRFSRSITTRLIVPPRSQTTSSTSTTREQKLEQTIGKIDALQSQLKATVVEAKAPETWTCMICTLINTHLGEECAACTHKRNLNPNPIPKPPRDASAVKQVAKEAVEVVPASPIVMTAMVNPNITRNKYRGVDNYNPAALVFPTVAEALNSKTPIIKTVMLKNPEKFELPQSSPRKKQAPNPPMAIPMDGNTYLQLLNLDSAGFVGNLEPFECSICFLEYERGEGAVLRDCLHTFCRECLARTVEYSEEPEVRCPYIDADYSCDSILQEREVRALVNQEIYEKHLTKSIRLAENRIENAFHCKTPNCRGWCIYEDNVNTFRCPVCRILNCLTCRAIHDGLNCKQYQERLKSNCDNNAEARRTMEFLQEMVEKGEAINCPICQVIVMKKWGCDWLKCSICKTEICWITRGPRWGPGGKGDTTGGCKCGVNGVKCHPKCNYCH